MDHSTANGQRMKEYAQYEELPSSPQNDIDDNSIPPILIVVSSSADEEQDIVMHPLEEVSLQVRGKNNDNTESNESNERSKINKINESNESNESNERNENNSRQILQNFIIMSILLSANHGAMVSCLAFATLELGSMGAYQSAILHLVFAMSSLMGATYTVKYLGAKTSLSIGMACYSLYVASFWIVLQYPSVLEPFVILGAIVGGLGGGLIWTAQGTYFGCASCEYATSLHSSEVAIRDNEEGNGDDDVGEQNTPEVPEEIGICYNNSRDDERIKNTSRSQQRRQQLRPRQRVQGQNNRNTNATSLFGGIFAFVYLALEVGTKVLSYVLLRNDNSSSSDDATNTKSSWNTVFAIYTIVALLSTLGMVIVKDYPTSLSYSPQPQQQQPQQHNEQPPSSKFMYQFTSAWHLLVQDVKMKYMIGLSAVFGFAAPFVNSYVNGEVLYKILSNDESSMTSNTVILDNTGGGSSSHLEYAGLFSAVTSIVAALCSLLFGHVAQYTGKGPILHFGSLCFAMVPVIFLFSGNNSDDATMSWTTIILIYVFQGIGRSTFEGTLKATFADFFSNDKESAFGNLVLQSGIFTSFGHYLSYGLQCTATGNSAAAGSDHHQQSSLASLSSSSLSPYPHQNYCIRSKDGLKCTSIIPSDEDSMLSSSHRLHHHCVRFKDGSLHNIAPLEWLIIVSCVLAILGYWRASILFHREQDYLHDDDNQNHQEEEDQDEVSILSSYNISMVDHKDEQGSTCGY